MHLFDLKQSLSKIGMDNAKVILMTPDMNFWKVDQVMVNLDNNKVIIFIKPQEEIYI